MRTLLGLAVVAHGFVTAAIWVSPLPAVADGQLQPPNPTHSWLLGDVRLLSLIFGVVVGVALIVTGVGFLMDQTWWPAAALAAGSASLLLFAAFFTPWWSAGIVISVALVMGALRASPA